MKKGIIVTVVITVVVAIVGIIAFMKKKNYNYPKCDISDCNCDGCGDCYDGYDETVEDM